MRIWYRVSDLDAARAFYRDVLGFTETFVDEDEGWVSLDRGDTEIAIGQAEDGGGNGKGHVGSIAVEWVCAGRAAGGAHVGRVLELRGAMRLLDVFAPDGNRIQLTEDVS